MRKCVTCGKGEMRPGTAVASLKIGGHRFSAEVSALLCTECDEAYFEGATLGRLETQAALELARSGEVTPESFRAQRKTLGLQAKELAGLLSLTPEQVSKYENGKAPVDRRAAALVAAMVLEQAEGRRDTLDRLESLRKPRKLRAHVRLKVA